MNYGMSAVISLSSDGVTIAIGDREYGGSIWWSGRVRVYQYDGIQWTKKGQTLHVGELYGGYSVSMSGDGLTFAVGHEIRDSFYGDDVGGQDWCLEGSIRICTLTLELYGVKRVKIDCIGTKMYLDQYLYPLMEMLLQFQLVTQA